jgi:hypothetical protein
MFVKGKPLDYLMDRTQNIGNLELSLVGSCNAWMRFVASMSYEVITDNFPVQRESNIFTKHNFLCKNFVVLKIWKNVSAAQYTGKFFIFGSYYFQRF